MKIVIIGDGKVGHKLTIQLSEENYDVVLIDQNEGKLKEALNQLDILCITGDGADAKVQKEAGVPGADLVVACASTDELNMLSCLLAKRLGAKHTIARVRNPIYYQQIDLLKEDLRLSMAVNPELMAAFEISRSILLPDTAKVETFMKGKVELVEFIVKERSHLGGVSLAELYRKFQIKVLVCAVRRGSEVIIPNGDFVIHDGDRLHIVASHKYIEEFFHLIGKRKEPKNILICGGGKVGYYLAKQLLGLGMQVKIIEQDWKKCEDLCDQLPKATIICGNAADHDLLIEEGIEQADALVSLTGMDEENIILALFAKTKGVDKIVAKVNEDGRAQLVEELGAGEVVGGAIDYYPVEKEPIVIPYDADKINALLGTDIDEATMVKYFEKLDLTVDTDKKEVIVPTWRQDLERLADLAEEVARFYGYDKIPMTLPKSSATAGGLSEKLKHEKAARIVVEGYGFNEGMTFSFESPKVYDKLNLPEDDVLRKSIKITNPLGEDYSVMRTSALGGMLTSLSTNYNRRNKNVRLYELANVYLPKQLPLTELPDERMQLTLGMYGDGDFFTMKGIIETLMTKLGLKKKAEYDPEAGKAFLHPGRQAKVMYDGVQIAYLGEVHPVVQKNFAIGERTYIAVVDMKAIMDMADFEVKYEGVPKFPAMTRDISLSMKKEVLAGDIEKVISKKGGKLVESYELFDVYEGSQLVKGFKSLAYKIVFRAKDHTLKDDEVNAAMDKIIKALAEMDVELRQ